jgi:hypothetical protein
MVQSADGCEAVVALRIEVATMRDEGDPLERPAGDRVRGGVARKTLGHLVLAPVALHGRDSSR